MKNLIYLFVLLATTVVNAQTILLSADRLFDGTEMHNQWSVLVKGNQIVEVGPTNQLTGKADSVINFGNSTLMPGMIEAHSHVLLYPYNKKNWNDQVLKESRSLRAIRGAKNAEKDLMAGFTTLRDLGSEGAGYADVGIKQSIEQGISNGPRLLVAGRAIVATGSYGPKGFIPDMEMHLGAEEADGNNLIKVVRDQIGHGADVVKVYADYRWGPNGESMPTFTIDELKKIVATANSSGRPVVAHASTEEGMRRAVLAGVSTIEHGSDATAEVLRLMKEHNVALCPTLAATYAITTYRGWDPTTQPEPDEIITKKKSFQLALKEGVTVIAGGDVGVFEHGHNAMELVLMSQYGMPNMDVLRSVTNVNAKVLGLKLLGNLKKGYWADIVAISGNPEKKIEDLYKVSFVMKDGVIYKSK